MSTPLTVSVVVPTRDRNADLELCLQAVDRLDPRPSEVLVVDSAPRGDGAREVARRLHARYVLEPRPGAARARNRGAAEATGDIVAYSDDDAVPSTDWLGKLLPEFHDPRVALVAGQVMAPAQDRELQPLYELCGYVGQGYDRIAVDYETPHWFEKVNFLPFGIGPNLAIRRCAFDLWHGFDERLGPGTPVPGHEEQRAFHQLIELGFRIVYQPAACVTHPLLPRPADELRRRSLHRMQASGAYLTLLLMEEPAHRREVLVHILHRLKQEPSAERSGETLPPLFKQLIARLQGPVLYFRSRLHT
jgi:O-antigen biosynthesis protein